MRDSVLLAMVKRQPEPFFVSTVPERGAFIRKSALLMMTPPSSPTIFMGEAFSTAVVAWSTAPLSIVKSEAFLVTPPRLPVSEYWLASLLTRTIPPLR